MKTKFRVAVIGHTGKGDYGHGMDSCFARNERCEIVALADADEAGRLKAAKKIGVATTFADYREMVEKTKPDIVSIGPRWLDAHCEIALCAAERGIHIYMEKPFVRDLKEADEVIAVCQRHNVKLAIAHQTRYSPVLQRVKQLLAEGIIGDILELRGRGKEDRRGGGEDLWVLGSHVLNMMQYLAGEPAWCSSTVWQDNHLATRDDIQVGNEGIGRLVGDHVVAMYGFERGAMGYFGCKKNAVGGRFGLQIFGSRGVIEVLTGGLPEAAVLRDPAWSPARSGTRWERITSAGIGKPEPLENRGLDGGNDLAVADLLDAISTDRQPECNMYEGRTTVEMIAGVFASHFERRTVDFPLKIRVNPLA